MKNLTLNEIATICNEKLNLNVFEVIDNTLMNTTNRVEGNDISLTIEDGEYISTSTGGTSYYGNSNGYVVAEDLIQAYNIYLS